MASQIQQYRAITSLLLELPDLVSGLQQRRSEAGFIAFLERAEGLLKDFGKRQSAALAAARGTLAAASLSKEAVSRKDRARLALDQVGPVESALVESIAATEEAMDAARPMIRQILQLIASSGTLKVAAPEQAGHLPEQIWAMATQHEQLAPLTVQARIYLNRNDALAMLLTEMDLEDFVSG